MSSKGTRQSTAPSIRGKSVIPSCGTKEVQPPVADPPLPASRSLAKSQAILGAAGRHAVGERLRGRLSVEHEDPIWGGSEERAKQGREIAYRTLRPLIVQ